MTLSKVAQQRYDQLRSQYNYGVDEAEEEANRYAKLVADAKPKKKRKSVEKKVSDR